MAPDRLTSAQKAVRREAFRWWMSEIEEKRGVKRYKIAEEIGVSHSTLDRPYSQKADAENRNAPKWNVLVLIEEKYNVPAPEELRPGYFMRLNSHMEAVSPGAEDMFDNDIPREDQDVLFELWRDHGTGKLYRQMRAWQARSRKAGKKGA